ncbi:MAG TPA: PAS domain S-box protein [Thermodesulfobacteriota bacterium]|nr:PAS domain S-box protein [Thermodesulfobacteriota bacterium]
MKAKWVIIFLSIFLLTCIAIVSFYQHKANERIFLLYFQEHQLLHAQHLAEQIETLLWAHRRILETFPSSASNPIKDKEFLKRDIRTYSRQMKEDYTDNISLFDKKGMMVFSTDRKVIGSSQGQRPFFLWAQKKENRERLFISPLLTGEEDWQAQMQSRSSDREDISSNEFKIVLAKPLYHRASSEKSGQWEWEFTGTLSFLIDLKKFLTNELKDYKLSEHHVWIIDRDGTVLFHSGHPEMKSKKVHQPDETCIQCHISFNYIDEILEKGEGTTDYTVKDLSRMLAGFASVKFADISWVVVVNYPYDRASAFIRKSLERSVLLLGTVFFSFLLGSAYLIGNERLKAKAQEEAKHWREKTILEDKIQQSKALYQTIVENAHDAIWTLDTGGHFTFLNRRGEEISGYKASELAGKEFESLIPPEDLPRAKGVFTNILQGKVESFEGSFYAKDGRIRLLSVNVVPLYEDGTVVGMFNIGRDVTEQRSVEKALRESEKQLRYLSSQLLTAQETERRRISRGIHDEMGQALSLIKLRLRFIGKELTQDQAAAKDECEAISQYINQVIENVRRLSRDLSPSILEDAGLLAAIQWLVTNSKTDHQIKMILDVGSIDEWFPRDAQITIYRILQEALTNIRKHARAKDASVVIKEHEGKVSFSVEDDGIGFDALRAATVNPDERGLGLAIMEERARMLGGSLEIWSEKGKGTRITFRVPLEKGGSV